MSKVDIIVPIYNSSKTINFCLNSIIHQTFRDITIILVNDGSTDNSLYIIKEFKKNDKRIKIINKKNAGLSSARNAGLDISTSDFVFFLDSDDYLINTAIEDLYHKSIETGADMSCGNVIVLNQEGKYLREIHLKEGLITNKEDIYSFLYLSKNKESFVYAWGKLYKKKIFQTLRFLEGRNWEDVQIYPYICEKIQKICCINSYTTIYFKTSGSITNSKFNQSYEHRFSSYFELFNYLKYHNLKKPLKLLKEILYRIFLTSYIKSIKDKKLKLFKNIVRKYYKNYKKELKIYDKLVYLMNCFLIVIKNRINRIIVRLKISLFIKKYKKNYPVYSYRNYYSRLNLSIEYFKKII